MQLWNCKLFVEIISVLLGWIRNTGVSNALEKKTHIGRHSARGNNLSLQGRSAAEVFSPWAHTALTESDFFFKRKLQWLKQMSEHSSQFGSFLAQIMEYSIWLQSQDHYLLEGQRNARKPEGPITHKQGWGYDGRYYDSDMIGMVHFSITGFFHSTAIACHLLWSVPNQLIHVLQHINKINRTVHFKWICG